MEGIWPEISRILHQVFIIKSVLHKYKLLQQGHYQATLLVIMTQANFLKR